MPALAAKGQQLIIPAILAFDAGEAVVQIAAIDEKIC